MIVFVILECDWVLGIVSYKQIILLCVDLQSEPFNLININCGGEIWLSTFINSLAIYH